VALEPEARDSGFRAQQIPDGTPIARGSMVFIDFHRLALACSRAGSFISCGKQVGFPVDYMWD
jgi:hypothetical protein